MRRIHAAAALGAAALLAGGATAASGTLNPSGPIASVLNNTKPRNVIFLLGDGMGTQEITSARYYSVGAAGKLNVDRMPLTGFDKTWSLHPAPAAPYLPDYVPDSASTGTEWATGKKTIDERISQGPSSDVSVPGDNASYGTVLEAAKRQGKRVGDVSTAEITDATPAVLGSHISLRGCAGPADTTKSCPTETKAAGGLGSIAEQEVDHNIDVLLGGGRSRFEQTTDAGGTVIDAAAAKGYRYVTDAASLDAAPGGKKVLGLFNASTMTTEWTGPAASLGAGNAPARCTEGNRPANEPSLSDMTRKALHLLDNPRGFFLQVEGASIDKQDHGANACGQIGETVAFDNAIGVALDYQRRHPDTLVVVTADHGHTSEIAPEDTTGSNLPTGYSTNLITADNAPMRLTWGTSGYGGEGKAPVTPAPSQQHTGTVVPVWGVGPGSSAILGTNDHTDLFRLLGGR